MEYGLDTKQLRTCIVRPTLQLIGLWSPSAENLVIGTAMQESRCTYLKQLGRGPALGIFQMEPATFKDIYDNFLTYLPAMRTKVDELAIGMPDAQEMEGNLYFATAMCRVLYRRVKAALPLATDARALAEYWKQYYNTHLGKGSVEEASPHFELAVKEGAL